MEYAGILDLRKFVAPECIFGADARRLAAKYAVNLGARKVLVVSDPGVIAAGWTNDVVESLKENGLPYVIFQDVTPNPRAHHVMSGAELYVGENCNCIITVGGGSSIDSGKGIGIVSTNKRHILEFEGVDEVRAPIPPLICVPTTGGSSADVSQFAIITDEEHKIKIAIVSKTIVPDVSLIDPVVLTTMPSDLSANTGFDVLVHACEAYVSNAQSVFTDVLALEAIRIITKYLPISIKEPLNPEYRGWVSMACIHAGFAFSNAGLGLTHAMAHAVAGELDSPHGLTNAILLHHVIEFNYSDSISRYRKIAEAMGINQAGMNDSEARSSLLKQLTCFQEKIGIGAKLRDLGLKPDMIPELAKKAMDDPDVATNPRMPTLQDIEDIYERAL
jgi:alcohol dehydrogenase